MEFSIVILDNASIDHVDCVVDTIQTVGALVTFLPPYSPDMNPIEEVFAEIKQYLQANDSVFQATSCPRTMILMAFASVTVRNCLSYIRHAGYKTDMNTQFCALSDYTQSSTVCKSINIVKRE